MSEFDLLHSNGIRIPHLSASTVNSFIQDRFGFYQSKVLGAPFTGNQYTCRGTAVEGAVNRWIETGCEKFEDNALAIFHEEFKKTGMHPLEAEDVLETIPKLARLAGNFYMDEFATTKAVTQHKINVNLEGVKRPIIGYLDFYQPSLRVRDSKVVSKTPSKLSQPYVLQGALYNLATGLPVVFDFFVPNQKASHKPILLTDEDIEFGISYLTAAAKAIEELEQCDNPKRVMELMSFPNLDAFYNVKDKRKAANAWGIKLKF
jgi:hypothetical protein